LASTDDDTQLRLIIEAASRLIDNYCGRWFYVLSGTKYYPGADAIVTLDDILSITTLKTDTDADGIFESTLTENTDFFLFPLNTYPKRRAEINWAGNYGDFAHTIQRGIQIVGLFGYGDGESATPYSSSGATLTASTSSTTSVTISSAVFEVGQTILVESEQMYITAVASTGLTVNRAVNGTTGAIHSAQTAYIYSYPSPIIEATLMTASRLWKRKETSFATIVGAPELGPYEIHRGLDIDVKTLLQPYVRTDQGWV